MDSKKTGGKKASKKVTALRRRKPVRDPIDSGALHAPDQARRNAEYHRFLLEAWLKELRAASRARDQARERSRGSGDPMAAIMPVLKVVATAEAVQFLRESLARAIKGGADPFLLKAHRQNAAKLSINEELQVLMDCEEEQFKNGALRRPQKNAIAARYGITLDLLEKLRKKKALRAEARRWEAIRRRVYGEVESN